MQHTPTNIFLDTLQSSWGASVECECGITHMCPDTSYEYDDRWRHDAIAGGNTDHRQVHRDVDVVLYYTIDNQHRVAECSCFNDAVVKYENWIWTNRDMIRHYLVDRIEQEKKRADHEYTKTLLLR